VQQVFDQRPELFVAVFVASGQHEFDLAVFVDENMGRIHFHTVEGSDFAGVRDNLVCEFFFFQEFLQSFGIIQGERDK